jgi:hypothetical protein
LLAGSQSGTVGDTIEDHQIIKQCPPIKQIALDEEDSADLKKMYAELYPHMTIWTV